MKKFFLRAAALSFVLSLCMACPSCAPQQQKEEKASAATAQENTPKHVLPNYRYVDIDTVLSKYYLALDYNEEMLRMRNNMESEVKRHENSIQSFATTIQNKMQNNGYLTEASYKADQEKFNNMQINAQKAVATLQSNYETAALNANMAVIDSITNYIKEYNGKKGYDAIFQKNATLYISPELDITADIVEGLNARYNKVKK